MPTFNLTDYEYFKPLNDYVGFYGLNHIFLLKCEYDYFLTPNKLYNIIKQDQEATGFSHCSNYKILDLVTFEYYNLLIHKSHKIDYMKTMFDLII